jgi:hypothetical protein
LVELVATPRLIQLLLLAAVAVVGTLVKLASMAVRAEVQAAQPVELEP